MANNYVDLPVGGSGSTGTVTSVGLTAPASILSVSGSPITTSGTLALSLAVQNANKIWAGPTTGADAAPTFRALVAADLPAVPLSLTNGHIFVGNGSNIATDVAMSGEATIANTGAVALSNAAVIAKVLTGYVSGAGTVSATDSILQAIQKLNGNDAGRLSATLTSAHIFVGNGSNVATDVAMTGDVSITNAGVTAVGTNKVANSQLAQMSANTLKGNNTGSPANAADLTTAQVKAMFLFPATLKTITTPVSNSGSTETTLMTYTVPGGTLAATGDFIEAEFSGSFASNDNSKLLRILFGATQLFTTVAVQQNGGSWNMQVTLVRTGAATQYVTTKFMVNGGLLQARAFNTTAAETLSGALAFKVAGTGDASSDITQSWASYVFNPGV